MIGRKAPITMINLKIQSRFYNPHTEGGARTRKFYEPILPPSTKQGSILQIPSKVDKEALRN